MDVIRQEKEDQKILVKAFSENNLQICTEHNNKIRNLEENASNWSDQTTTQLHSIQERTGKFLLEELRRDTPTGKFLIFISENI